ncbi:MAG: autotransporter domain-containing protein, partial [Bacteriovoracaceae bacterium]|nr:autotransporter domain-containing protein [Bacteriovoracaceae bacterium]
NSGLLNAGNPAAILEISDSAFNKNKSSWGGAISNSGKLDLTRVNFTGNVAEFNDRNGGGSGGAIFNYWDLTVNGGLWKENTAFDGGAIFNRDKATISSTFIGNQAFLGGAIYNENRLTVANSTFMQNQALEDESDSGLSDNEGGAIYNEGTLQVTNSSFTENDTGFTGGAIFNGRNAVITDTTFTDNEVESYGGAIYSQSNTSLSEDAITITRATFTGNKAMGNPGAPSLGGAVYNDKGKMTISQSTFEGNEARGSSASSGGAIAISGRIVSVEQQDPLAILEISDSTFRNNISSWGGAVDNGGKMDMANVTFIENKAIFNPEHGGCGGAIVNGVNAAGPLTITNGTYLRNSATGNGGAINNRGTLNLQGTNFFEGNTSISGLNDIDNQGTINISGEIILDGGISGFHGSNNYGTVVFARGTKLTVKPGTTVISKNNVQNDGALLIFNIDNGFSGDYALITDYSTLDYEFMLASNKLYNITPTGELGTYTISKKSNAEVADSMGVSQNEANTVAAIISGGSTHAAYNKVASDISNLMQSGEQEELAAGIAAVHALAPNTAPIVPQIQTATTNLMFQAVGSRLSGATFANLPGTTSGDAEKSAAVWMQGLMGQAKFDQTAQLEKFKVDTYGTAFGLEKVFGPKLRLGIGYAYGNTDADTTNRTTKVKTHSLLAYGEHKPKRWFINGILHYGRSNYQEDKNVAGNVVVAKYNIKSLGGQVMLGYDWHPLMVEAKDETKNDEKQVTPEYHWSSLQLAITPAIGLRYIRLNTDDYVDTAGQDVVVGSRDILTGIFGAKIGAILKMENGLRLIPEAQAAVTYDAKQAKIESKVTLPNDASYRVSGNNLDRVGTELGVSLTAQLNNHFAISANYTGKLLKSYTNHSGLLGLNYRF